MTYLHAFLEIVGVLAILASILLILGASCLAGKREDLTKFGEDPFKPKLKNIVRLPNVDRMCPGKPHGGKRT